jgi:hypothetical protein
VIRWKIKLRQSAISGLSAASQQTDAILLRFAHTTLRKSARYRGECNGAADFSGADDGEFTCLPLILADSGNAQTDVAGRAACRPGLALGIIAVESSLPATFLYQRKHRVDRWCCDLDEAAHFLDGGDECVDL